MTHGFVQCLASLLVQAYLLLTTSLLNNRAIYLTSCSLSLVNICWALASFNKNIHRKNLHRLM
jgi:hypothetical protein